MTKRAAVCPWWSSGTSGARYYTDSNGLIAFYEPGLMGRKVFFAVASPGYEFAPDGFGIRGAVLETKPGE